MSSCNSVFQLTQTVNLCLSTHHHLLRIFSRRCRSSRVYYCDNRTLSAHQHFISHSTTCGDRKTIHGPQSETPSLLVSHRSRPDSASQGGAVEPVKGTMREAANYKRTHTHTANMTAADRSVEACRSSYTHSSTAQSRRRHTSSLCFQATELSLQF